MASITVMKNFIIKKAQGTSDDKLKTIVKILKNYNKLDSDSRKKIQPAIEKLYSKYKEKDSGSKETKKAGSKVSKKKFKTQDFKDVISKFKAKIGQKLWKEATSGTTIQQDAERPAKPKGKRYVSKKGYTTNQYGRYKNQVGTPYWETRANRFDIKQPAKTFPKLAKGGEVGEEKYYYFEVSYSHAPRNRQKLAERTWRGVWAKSEKEAIRQVEKNIRAEYKHEKPPHFFDKMYAKLISVSNLKEYIAEEKRRFEEQQERMNNPKEFAKGGKVSSEQRNRMFNFLKEDLRELEIAIQKNDKQEIEKFFSYWETHLDSLK